MPQGPLGASADAKNEEGREKLGHDHDRPGHRPSDRRRGMNTKTIDGIRYGRMLMGGAALLAAHAEELNAMNVFPVSDGDTGSNMSRTLEGGLAQLDLEQDRMSIGAASKKFAHGALLSARGNSGVILSQIFAGINERLEDREEAGAAELAEAYRCGIAKSYAAVQHPTEGTILTVFRESTEHAAAALTEDSAVEDFYAALVEEGRRSLEGTKDLLPVLAEAGVVDSGGAGFLYLTEGMYETLTGKPVEYTSVRKQDREEVDLDRFTRDSVLEFGYCTEFFLRLMSAKVDPDAFEIGTILEDLRELGGESVVAFKQDDVVKVHVHTMTPGLILSRMQKYGEFLTVKIENMSLGHSETVPEETAEAPGIRKPFAVVAVAMGDGIAGEFKALGADVIIRSSPSENPSIEDFLEAFRRCEAETILVFPNHKNIMLAANSAAGLYTDAKVRVIESRSVMQGYCGLSVVTPGISDVDELISDVERAAGDVADFEITRAIRDAEIGGLEIREGDYIAISSGKIVAVSGTPEDAVLDALETADADLCEILTVFAGKDVAPERKAALQSALEEQYEDLEIVMLDGGQETYDYYAALE